MVNDATGTNLRLEDRHGGASKTLLHPAARLAKILPFSFDLAASIGAQHFAKLQSVAFSPGHAWIATTCSDGTLSVYDLAGTEHDATLSPALHLSLGTQPPPASVLHAVPWFDPDGSALNVAYTEGLGRGLTTVQRMRLPLA